MRHPRRKHKGYRGPRATPWKYRIGSKLIRRGKVYDVLLVKDGEVVFAGPVRG